MAKGNEQARAAASDKKDKVIPKKRRERQERETSSDSDVERAAEAEEKRNRERGIASANWFKSRMMARL